MHFLIQPYEVDALIILILQMTKLRLRVTQALLQGLVPQVVVKWEKGKKD